ncbi:MAG TPA: phosphotransferase [Pilimelia sp.]|nr:phosphotransferase [Pilimelia sp.]
MEPQWPQVRPIAGERLVAEVRDRTGIRLELLGRLPGGQVGAALVRLPDGSTAVMSSWSRERYDRIPVITRVVDRLREAGYPAPGYRHVIDCGDVVAVVQDYVDGGWVGAVTVGLLRNLLELNGRQRQVFDRPVGSLADLYLSQDGPGFCLHAPLISHSVESRALLDWIHEVGRTASDDVFRGTDAVHTDFHPGNVLLARGSTERVAGVVDWTGATIGDCGLDLVTLGFACDFMPTEPPVVGLLRDHIRATVPPEQLVAFTAHMALRMVDWAIRHFPPRKLAHWIAIAQDWRSFALDTAHGR